MSHTPALPLGLKMKEYKIVKVLGHGGFGITYLAVDKNLSSPKRNVFVAIKEYFPNSIVVRGHNYEVLPQTIQDAEDYKWGLEQFLKEAKTLATFNHPNIIKVLRFFEMNNTAYFVMEYASGVSLSKALKEMEVENENIPEEDIRSLLFPLLDALKVIHDEGCLHRDIKPANIYIRDHDSQPVLLDFGAARFSLGQYSKSISTIITPGYAPVEQYQTSMKNQGAWTDIYALAATIYRIVAGTVPTDAFTRYSAVNEGNKDALPPVEKVARGKFSPVFLKALMYGLNIEKDQRPQTALEWKAVFDSEKIPNPKPNPKPLPIKGKSFEVYENPNPSLGYRAVKDGFSWPMFFAGILLPLILIVVLGVKKMWWHMISVIGVYIVYGFVSLEMGKGSDIIAIGLGVIVSLLYGFKGNYWYATLLRKKGYNLFDTVSSPNPEAAISVAVRKKI